MKKNLFRNVFMAVIAMTIFANVFTGCKSSTNPPVVVNSDKTKLTALIDSCTTILANANTANYTTAAITTFTGVLTAAKAVAASTTVTQTSVDNTVIQLRNAEVAFLASQRAPIPAGSITFALMFDEGTGTTLTTTGNDALTAVLVGGPVTGFTGLPTFVAGHNGTGKAMHFGLGSHLEIATFPAADLLKSQLSISVWVKPDTTYANNYIISYNSYHTWKFQLQDGNRPFFTFGSTVGIMDADDGGGGLALPGVWTHLVVTLDLTAGTETFYVNGANIIQYTKAGGKADLAGTLAPPSVPTPLVIGTDAPFSAPLPTNFNFNYFKGAMDNLEFYNIALSDGQVGTLYNSEK